MKISMLMKCSVIKTWAGAFQAQTHEPLRQIMTNHNTIILDLTLLHSVTMLLSLQNMWYLEMAQIMKKKMEGFLRNTTSLLLVHLGSFVGPLCKKPSLCETQHTEVRKGSHKGAQLRSSEAFSNPTKDWSMSKRPSKPTPRWGRWESTATTSLAPEKKHWVI